MNRVIEFAKLSGSGNDFICIDNRDGRFDALLDGSTASGSPPSGESAGQFARTLCRRGMGVGADGLIFAVQPEVDGVADIAARFFEPDGSEVELCGNGTGCFVYWVIVNGWAGPGEIRILTPAGVVRGHRRDDGYIRVCVPSPEGVRRDLPVAVEGRPWRCDYVVTGVPHAIVYVDDVEATDVNHWGRALRRHPDFGPRGANVNFVQVLGEGHIAVRTYEFGVEDETLACGTGSASAAILAATRFGWAEKYLRGDEPVEVLVRSGDTLRVWFTAKSDGAVADVCLETIVRWTYTGTLGGDLLDRALPGAADEPAPAGERTPSTQPPPSGGGY